MLQCCNNLFRLNNLRHGKISANDWWVSTRIEQIHPAAINLSGGAVRAAVQATRDVVVSNERRAYRARINNRKMLFLISRKIDGPWNVLLAGIKPFLIEKWLCQVFCSTWARLPCYVIVYDVGRSTLQRHIVEKCVTMSGKRQNVCCVVVFYDTWPLRMVL